jgi:hypothetical protein
MTDSKSQTDSRTKTEIHTVRLSSAKGARFYVECYADEKVADLCKLLTDKYPELVETSINLLGKAGPLKADSTISEIMRDAVPPGGVFRVVSVSPVQGFSGAPCRPKPPVLVGGIVPDSAKPGRPTRTEARHDCDANGNPPFGFQ